MVPHTQNDHVTPPVVVIISLGPINGPHCGSDIYHFCSIHIEKEKEAIKPKTKKKVSFVRNSPSDFILIGLAKLTFMDKVRERAHCLRK